MSLREMMDSILTTALSRARVFGLYPYVVEEDDHGLYLTPGEGSPHFYVMPKRIRKLYGSHGLSSVAVKGSRVLIGFVGGNLSSPYVAHYYNENPASMLLDAEDHIQIATTSHAPPGGSGGGGGGSAKHVYVGSENRQPVARKTDPVSSGVISFSAGAGVMTIVYTPQGGTPQTIGTLAASGLVFTPDPSTGGMVNISGNITDGSSLLSSE